MARKRMLYIIICCPIIYFSNVLPSRPGIICFLSLQGTSFILIHNTGAVYFDTTQVQTKLLESGR